MLRSSPTRTQSSPAASVRFLLVCRPAMLVRWVPSAPPTPSGGIERRAWLARRLSPDPSSTPCWKLDGMSIAGSDLRAGSNLLRTAVPGAEPSGHVPAGPSGGAANASRLAVNHNPPSTTSV